MRVLMKCTEDDTLMLIETNTIFFDYEDNDNFGVMVIYTNNYTYRECCMSKEKYDKAVKDALITGYMDMSQYKFAKCK